jgi:DNA repair exonuclease SbcCD ATPase subunit
MDARYRLAPMRDIRAREQRVRQGDLAGAVGDARELAAGVAGAGERVAALQAALGVAAAERDRALIHLHRQRPAVADLVQRDRYLQRLRRELEAARGELARAEAKHLGQLGAVAAARAHLTRARAAREVIERHFAAWRAARQQLADRRED